MALVVGLFVLDLVVASGEMTDARIDVLQNKVCSKFVIDSTRPPGKWWTHFDKKSVSMRLMMKLVLEK